VELCVNGAGGQAVSLDNLRAARRITQQRGVALVLDATRILENAVQIKERDEPRSQLSLWEIVREICAQADALTMSLSKDLPTPIGGLLALRDDAPFQQGLDFLMAMGDGLSRPAKASIHAALRYAQDDPRYIERRVALVRRLHDGLSAKSFPLVRPAGGHAVFIRVGQLVPHLEACEFPGEADNLDWYAQFGVRGATLPLPPHAARDPLGLLRLAVPSLGMGEREVDRTGRDLGAWFARRGRTRGLRATSRPPVAGGACRARSERLEEVSA
jgi:tryptophanase